MTTTGFRAALLLMGFSFFATIGAKADSIRFNRVSDTLQWNAAMEESIATGKPVFVAVHTSWCRYCRLLEHGVYNREDVAAYFNEHFVNVMLDGEKEYGAGFSARYRVQGFPTLFFLDQKGTVLQQVNGYVEAAELLAFARKALRRHSPG